MALDVGGALLARLGARVDDDGFDRWERRLDAAERRSRRGVEVPLRGDLDDRGFRRFDDRMDDTERKSRRMRAGVVGSFGAIRLGVAGAVAAGTAGLGLLGKSFLETATSIGESTSKNRVLFGQYAKDVEGFAKTSARTLGISRASALEATGTFGNLFRALEIGPKASADMSVSLTKLAADLASFNNASPEEALEAIRSGLVGETEPLRKFGVNLNDAALRAEALKQGLISSTKEALTPQQKALAVNALLFKQTEKAQGDFQRTSGGLANQQRILKAQLSDVGGELGNKLMPIALKVVRGLNDLASGSGRAGRMVRTIGAAAGDAARWVGDAFDRVRGAFNGGNKSATRLAGEFRKTFDAIIAAGRRLWSSLKRTFDGVEDDLASIGRNVLKVLAAFESVAQPIVRRIIPGIVAAVEGLATIVRGVVRVIAGILSGDFGKAWQGVKDIVGGALKAVVGLLRAGTAPFREGAARLGKVVINALKSLPETMLGLATDAADALIDGIVAGIRAGAGKVGDAVKSVIPGPVKKVLGLFGDGIGRVVGRNASAAEFELPAGGGGVGLMGAQAALGPFASLASRFGLGVTSGRRPGSITSSGNVSYHSTGEAIDVAGPPSGMLQFFRYMRDRFGPRLAELIYTPGGAGIKSGASHVYTGAVAADHYDHVHVALDTGRPGVGDGIGRVLGAIRDRFTGDGPGKKTKRKAKKKGPDLSKKAGRQAVNRGIERSVARGERGIRGYEDKIQGLEREYGQLDRRFGLSEEVLLIEHDDGSIEVDNAAVAKRARELGDLLDKRRQIKETIEAYRRAVGRAIRKLKDGIKQLERLLSKATGKARQKERGKYREEIRNYRERIGELRGIHADLGFDAGDARIDLEELRGELTEVTGAKGSPAPPAESGDPGGGDAGLDTGAGDTGSSEPAAEPPPAPPSALDIATAAAEQLRSFQASRADLFATAGANFMRPADVVNPSETALAAGARYWGGGSSGSERGVVAGAGGAQIVQHITFAGPQPADPHTFTQAALHEMKAAL